MDITYYVDQAGIMYKDMLNTLSPFVIAVLAACAICWLLPAAFSWVKIQWHRATDTEDLNSRYDYNDDD